MAFLTSPRRGLGVAGPRVRPLGLGCMGMSWGYAEGARDDGASVAVIRQALDAGVELLDTAAVYGDGHNETLLGRALAGGRADHVTVATKVGLVVDDLATKRMHRDGRPETLRGQVHESLARLRTERVDLLYLHRVDPDVPLVESWGAMAELVDEGIVAGLGLSEVSVPQAEQAHAIHPVSAIQSELSLWTRDPLGDDGADDAGQVTGAGGVGTSRPGNVLGWCEAHGVALVPFAPLGRGYLTGTLSAGSFDSADFRASNPRFTAEAFDRNGAIMRELALVASAHEATPAQVALSWLLSLSEAVVPIPGTRSGHHLEENLGSADLRLSEAERARPTALPAAFGSRY